MKALVQRLAQLSMLLSITLFAGAQAARFPIKSRVSPDGRYVVAGSEDGRAYVWNAETGAAEVAGWDVGFPDNLCAVAWHPAGHGD